MSPEVAVGTALYQQLEPALGAVKFYDYVPASGTPTPLVALGVIGTRRSREYRCGRVWEVGFRLHVMSKAPGREEAWGLIQTLRETLDGVTLTLADPYAAETPLKEMRSGDMNDRLQAVAMSFVDFEVTVSTT